MIARIGFRLTRALLIGCAKGAAFARRVLVEDAGVNDMLPRLELSIFRLPTFGRPRESSASSIPFMFGTLLLRSAP